ncbi:MAG: LysR family transcriptional regulator [Kiloniellales bacterium]|nr:LysR family transcriptional regulator [Kiloniellales bacterium]
MPAPAPFSNWDDLRFFLETAKAGSISKAAKWLNTTQATISRRILNLEERLETRLFDRLPSGVVLTPEGEAILETVRHIEDAVLKIHRRVLGSDRRLAGPVRISAPDGLTTFLLAPSLGRLHEAYPSISVEFQCSTQPCDILASESDLCIQCRRPESPELIAIKLGIVHGVLWASPGYLERFGVPATAQDLLHHRLLDNAHYQYLDEEFSAWSSLLRAAKGRRFWTNSSPSLLAAAQGGVGIAILPTYICEFVDDILPLNLDVRARIGVWLVYHPNVKGAARVRAVIDWIRDVFDQEDWPWFRDEFHPPRMLGTATPARRGRPVHPLRRSAAKSEPWTVRDGGLSETG